MSELKEEHKIHNISNSPSIKKIIDFTHIERFTECSLCMEQYDNEKYLPRILPCSHTYCNSCLKELIKTIHNDIDEEEREEDQERSDEDLEFTIKCPQCLSLHVIQNGSIGSFPRNLALLQLIDIKPTELISDKCCESCMSDFAFSNCLHCSRLVCLDCKDKHRVEFKNKIEKSVFLLNEKCNKFIDDFKNKIKEFLLSSNNTKLYLSASIARVVNELRKREEVLLKNIDQIVNEKLNWFNKIQDTFIDMNTKVQEFLAETAININGDKYTDDYLFKYDQECQQHLINLITFDTIHSKNNIKINLKFSKDSKKNILKSIENFGKVYIDDNKTELIKCESSVELTPPNSPKTIKSLNNLINSPSKKVNNDEIVLNYQKVLKKDEDAKIKFWCPSGVKYDSMNNQIIIADSFNHQIKIINVENKELLRSYVNIPNEKEKLNTPRDLCLRSNGDIVVSDSGNNRFCILDKENLKIISTFGEFGYNKGQFNNPRGICIDSLDRIYVCDRNNHRIQVFDSKGNWLKEWGSQGSLNGEFYYPEFICVSEKKHLIVSDTHNHRIQIFDIDSIDSEKIGVFLTSFGSYGKKSGLFRFPRGVTTDSEGFIMVADWKNNRLQLFEPNGNFVTEINNKSNKLNNSIRFDKPVGISLISNGSLVVTNWGRSQNFLLI